MASTTSVPSLRPWLLSVTAATAALTLLSTLLRLLSRRLAHQTLWHDDRLILAATLSALASASLVLATAILGLGLPPSPAQTQSTPSALVEQLLLAHKLLYTWGLCLAKLGVLLMYRRVFDLSRAAAAMLVAVGGFVVVWSCTGSLLFVLACAPVRKLWVHTVPGHCIDQVGRWVANAASTMLTDMAVMLLAAPQLCRIKKTLSCGEKLGVAVVFAMGFFAIFSSAYRFSHLFATSAATATYTMAPPTGWSEIELTATLVAANLPTLKPLLDRLCGLRRQRQPSQDTVLSAGSWLSSSSPGGKKLSADSGIMASPFAASATDAWAWIKCVESNTRPVELAKNQHRATASRGRDSEIFEVPLYGINVTTDFRRVSVVDTAPASPKN